VPVRIALDNPPADLALISGRTATVTLDQQQEQQQGQQPEQHK
jgi:multidrug resistance efflux pump